MFSFQRCIHELSEVPILFLVRHSSRNPALPQLQSRPEPPSHDAVARHHGVPRLRMVGVLDSAFLALRRLAAVDASAAGCSYGVDLLGSYRRADLVAFQADSHRADASDR